jgi:ubiquinone/menaquinone biosynthesis C-methylase UbiE
MPGEADRRFIPALRFHSLTPLFDPVVALVARERRLKSIVLERAAISGGDEVLDLGCGTGTLAIRAATAVPAARVTGLDADPAILERARMKARRAGVKIDFDEGLAGELPYENGRFDVVLSTLLFHHLPDPEKQRAAREVKRVLAPGGRVVVGDVGRPHDPLMRVAVATTVQLVDGRATTASNVRGELAETLEEAGLREVSVADRLRTPSGTVEVLTASGSELHKQHALRAGDLL